MMPPPDPAALAAAAAAHDPNEPAKAVIFAHALQRVLRSLFEETPIVLTDTEHRVLLERTSVVADVVIAQRPHRIHALDIATIPDQPATTTTRNGTNDARRT